MQDDISVTFHFGEKIYLACSLMTVFSERGFGDSTFYYTVAVLWGDYRKRTRITLHGFVSCWLTSRYQGLPFLRSVSKDADIPFRFLNCIGCSVQFLGHVGDSDTVDLGRMLAAVPSSTHGCPCKDSIAGN